MNLIKLEIKAGRDAYYTYSKIYHTLTDVRFWLAFTIASIWFYMIGV